MAEGQPFRIQWAPVVNLPEQRLAARLEAARDLPREQRGVHPHPVAVVGGGPSLVHHLDELRQWPGEIWAVNSMADWLGERGIDATLFTVDPAFIEAKTQKRLLASCCDPRMFTPETRVFDMLEHAPDGVTGGVTSASRAPALAIKLGYPGIAFFGCDSSFEDDTGHVALTSYDEAALIVKANGRTFQTVPEFVMQAESIAQLLRTFPYYFVNRSEGFLAAMVADEQWTTVAVSAAMKKALIDANGDSGLYDKPYEAE
jgi:hypothetical protein